MAVLFKKRAIPIKPFPKPSSHTPGDIITWDEKEWLVCHYDSSNNQVYLISRYLMPQTMFGYYSYYKDSTLALKAVLYQINTMSAAALNMCVDVTVNSVTAKVFVPSKEQMDGEFDYFNSNPNRIAKYNGSAEYYWTSSANGSNNAWYVYPNGTISGGNPGGFSGFRPCVCVQL